jgi:hypothetical protein
VFDRAKAVNALDRAAIVIGSAVLQGEKWKKFDPYSFGQHQS